MVERRLFPSSRTVHLFCKFSHVNSCTECDKRITLRYCGHILAQERCVCGMSRHMHGAHGGALAYGLTYMQHVAMLPQHGKWVCLKIYFVRKHELAPGATISSHTVSTYGQPAFRAMNPTRLNVYPKYPNTHILVLDTMHDHLESATINQERPTHGRQTAQHHAITLKKTAHRW